MCGRYTLRTRLNQLLQMYSAESTIEITPRYNIAPTQIVPVLRFDQESGVREIVTMKWGLIPSWAKDESIGNKMINARSETVDEKPAYRSAFKRRRCLVLADGFYEWQKKGSKKQPYLFQKNEAVPCGFAGLWETWKKDNQTIESCTIITTTANELVQDVHDRMPVILQDQYLENWLNNEYDHADRLKTMLAPYPEREMMRDPVSSMVSSPKNDQIECTKPVKTQDSLFD
ncbi:SOS response-associated peptidase [Bremerella sp. T1]|uniref:SOS response-associated peptidase n=1 Tax=Bremerella sp. TYQ1 TaxID=3119568 RepID=UPI001CCB0F00|nr:SOS response-associated peptidase [Bremerella volcania]UBM37060.1 SOS response-associated peptidase [Bremerella volcania]